MITTSTASGSDVVPQLAYAKPEWGGTETLYDPYEMRLDPKATIEIVRTENKVTVQSEQTRAALANVIAEEGYSVQ